LNRICLYEREPTELLPLVWLRPVWDLRVGALTLEERVKRLWPDAEIAYAGRSLLNDLWIARRGRALVEPVPLGDTLFLEAGFAASSAVADAIAKHDPPYRLVVGDVTVGYHSAAAEEQALPGGELLAQAIAEVGRGWPSFEIDAVVVRSLPDPIRYLERLFADDASLAEAPVFKAEEHPGVTRVGEGTIRVEPGVTIDPGTTLDAREGPITLLSGATLTHGTWLKGPAAVGRDTHLLGGVIGPFVATGPACKIRGEVAETILQGCTNKAHDGFIGHSFLGEWVNLGALTTCSDLKNNYSEVRLVVGGRMIATGLSKLGVMVGDHAKTAIGTLLSTGAVVGPAANVFGASGLSGKAIPMFAWGEADHGGKGSYDIDRCIQTARVVMSRRSVEMEPAYEELLRRVHELR